MPIDVMKGGRVDVEMWTQAAGVEDSALKQLRNVAALPWVFHHVAVMPDVHFGIGCTVGSVIAMQNAVAPAAVGVDIGCGMSAVRTNLRIDDVEGRLKQLRHAIESAIPVGFGMHEEHALVDDLDLADECKRLFADIPTRATSLASRAVRQMGSLGGGNHFIELQYDTDGNIWLMLHSGSRGVGNELAKLHIDRARKLAHNAELPDPDLAVFLAGTPEMAEYRRDLYWAQEYAALNRRVMMDLYRQVVRTVRPGASFFGEVSCHHNYVAEEVHFVVRGLGNARSFESASHGAGRKMSRGAAKRTFTAEQLAEQTAGVECRKDTGVLDEIPGAYKRIEDVMENQRDLVEIAVELKQLLCVKG